MLDYTQEEVVGKHIVEITASEEGTFATTMGDEITGLSPKTMTRNEERERITIS
jgi:hypothetical protein